MPQDTHTKKTPPYFRIKQHVGKSVCWETALWDVFYISGGRTSDLTGWIEKISLLRLE